MIEDDIQNFTVLKEAHKLVLMIYRASNKFPPSEDFGLTSQIRRAAVSIPSNIVEGKARGSQKDYKRFVLIARGSLEEVKYQLFLAKELNYLPSESYSQIRSQADYVGRLVNGLLKSINRDIAS